MKLFFLCLCLVLTSTCFAKKVEYYKCVTERGVMYSQFPCGSNAIAQRLEHQDPDVAVPDDQHTKVLNDLERKQIIHTLERKIRASKQKVAILDRERDRAKQKALDKLERMMSDQEKRQMTRDVKSELQQIDKQYMRNLKEVSKNLLELEKQLKKFSK